MSSLGTVTEGRPSQNDSLVIIPMYNEKENASAIIDAVLSLPRPFDVLVIDEIGRASCRERV